MSADTWMLFHGEKMLFRLLKCPSNHQHVQVPEMEVLNLKRLFWGWIFLYISRIHTAYIGVRTSILGTNEMFSDQKEPPQVG